MTAEDRVQAVAEFGFTERQARFLVLVMRHAGVCVPRQYASFAGIGERRREGERVLREARHRAGTRSPAAASTTARGSITSITSRSIAPSANPRVATAGRCRRAGLWSV